MVESADLRRVLKAIGYAGDCLEDVHLQWALRCGGISFQFQELTTWLGNKFHQNCSEAEYKAANNFLSQLRRSILNANSCGEINPTTWRRETLGKLLALLYAKIKDHQVIDNLWRVYPNHTVGEAAKRMPILFIYDMLSPTGKIPDNRWTLLKLTITSTIQKLISPHPMEVFYEDHSDTVSQLRKVACSNLSAHEILKCAMDQLPTLWSDALITFCSPALN